MKTELEKFFELDEDEQKRIFTSYQSKKAIKRQYEFIQSELNERMIELKVLQEECQHPMATRFNRSDTGNWDRSQDSYWVECVCLDCGKRWHEDQ